MDFLKLMAAASVAAAIAPAAWAAAFDAAVFESFVVGQTTQAEVIRRAGPPTAEQPGRGRDRVLFYEFTGVSVNGAAPRDITVVVVIDEKKKVRIVRFYGRD